MVSSMMEVALLGEEDCTIQPAHEVHIRLNVLGGRCYNDGIDGSQEAIIDDEFNNPKCITEIVEVLRMGIGDRGVPQHRRQCRPRMPGSDGVGAPGTARPEPTQKRGRGRPPKTAHELAGPGSLRSRRLKYVDAGSSTGPSSNLNCHGKSESEEVNSDPVEDAEAVTGDVSQHVFQTSDPRTLQEPSPEVSNTEELSVSSRSPRVHGLYCCEVCQKGYPKLRALLDHEREHQEQKYACPLCNKRFRLPKLVRKHQRVHKKTKGYECSECGDKFRSQPLLLEHLHSHTGSEHLQCGRCGLLLPDRRQYHAHLRRHTTDAKLGGICTQCDGRLSEHHRCPRQEPLLCPHPDCGRRLATERRLQRHLLQHMPAGPPWQCTLCQKQFRTKYSLRDHVRAHSGERPFGCVQCEARFALKSNLMMHVRYVHENDRRFECGQCGRRFKRRRLLRFHELLHSGGRLLQCPQCPAQMVLPEHLRQHMLTHSAERPHICSVCGRSFARADNLKAHQFTHSGRKPFECRQCGVGFLRKMALRQHVQLSGHGGPGEYVARTRRPPVLPEGATAGSRRPDPGLGRLQAEQVVVLIDDRNNDAPHTALKHEQDKQPDADSERECIVRTDVTENHVGADVAAITNDVQYISGDILSDVRYINSDVISSVKCIPNGRVSNIHFIAGHIMSDVETVSGDVISELQFVSDDPVCGIQHESDSTNSRVHVLDDVISADIQKMTSEVSDDQIVADVISEVQHVSDDVICDIELVGDVVADAEYVSHEVGSVERCVPPEGRQLTLLLSHAAADGGVGEHADGVVITEGTHAVLEDAPTVILNG